MAKGKDERHNPNRKVEKPIPFTLKNIVMGLIPQEEVERRTRRNMKEYMAATSQEYKADPLFAHNEYMEQAELRAEQIKDMRKNNE